MFFVRVVVGESFTGRANVNVLLRHVTEVLFAEPPSDVDARGHRLGQRDRDARFLARRNLLAVEVAAIGDGIEVLHFQRRLRPLGHGRLRPVVTDVGHLMRDDQMMLGVDRDLDVVADDTGASAESGARCSARFPIRPSPQWVMYGRRPRCKRNLTISEAFGCGHVFGL